MQTRRRRPAGRLSAVAGPEQIFDSVRELSDDELHNLAEVVRQVQIERAIAAGDEETGKKAEIGGMLITLMFIVSLYLMVFKPGA